MHIWFRSKFDFRKLSTLLIGSFFYKTNLFEPNEHFFQKYESSLEVYKAKIKFSENPYQNVLELYSVLVQVQFATSKTKLDIYYNKLSIQVALRVTN